MTVKAFLKRRRRYLHQRRSSNSAPSGEDATSSMQVKEVGEQSENMPLDNTTLSSMLTGQMGTILDLRGGRGLVGRLASLGFTPGASVEMLQNYGHGPLIVEVRDVRIALGRGEAQKVQVRLNHSSKIATKKDVKE